jgi:hypothetical protein
MDLIKLKEEIQIMQDNGKVYGGKEWAVPIRVLDRIYVHTNIEKVPTDDGSELYSYNEKVYGQDELLEKIGMETSDTISKTKVNSANIDYIAMMTDVDIPSTEAAK